MSLEKVVELVLEEEDESLGDSLQHVVGVQVDWVLRESRGP